MDKKKDLEERMAQSMAKVESAEKTAETPSQEPVPSVKISEPPRAKPKPQGMARFLGLE